LRETGSLTGDDWKELAGEARRVFALNEVDQGEVYYHMPSHNHYPSLFGWDSGFHAAAMTHLDVKKAERELETLFRQVGADGHLPHEVLLPNSYSTRWTRGLQTRLVRWEFDGRGASFMVDPPSYHYAAEMAYRRNGDLAWLRRIFPLMCRSLDYLLLTRNIRGEGLISILHPWESGTDMSPQFFQAMGIRDRGMCSSARAWLYPAWLYAFNRAAGWRAGRLARANHFVCEDLTINCLAVRACRSMSFLACELGRRHEEGRYRRQAEKMMDAMDGLLWDEREGCYFPRFGYRRPRLLRRRTAASLLPLFTGMCRKERAERLIGEHLLDPASFWTTYPVPFNPAPELKGTGGWADNHLWAGHCVWTNFSWMLSIGLGEYGHIEEAREMTARVVRMVLREGFYEYYDARSGGGRRIPDFCWPALTLDMMARFWPQAINARA
jgi:Mannosylglycerate hydrolase MGH1-like glycoside hydrolase domain